MVTIQPKENSRFIVNEGRVILLVKAGISLVGIQISASFVQVFYRRGTKDLTLQWVSEQLLTRFAPGSSPSILLCPWQS